MSQASVRTTIAVAEEFYARRSWPEAHGVLTKAAAGAEGRDRAELTLRLVDGYIDEDWHLGLTNAAERRAALDELDGLAANSNDRGLRAETCLRHGLALHIDFIMAADTGGREREADFFADAAERFEAEDRADEAAFATAMLGICHHVCHLDRETAQPLLNTALEMAPKGRPTYARAEATRHLGQIEQELGRPANALTRLDESWRENRALGDSLGMAAALQALAFAHIETAELSRAADELSQARRIAEEIEAPLVLAFIARTEAELAFVGMAPGVSGRTHP